MVKFLVNVLMYQRYKTDHSNQVHQLVVTVSRHFYITSAGKFKYQKKPLEAQLEHLGSHTKRHIVHYLIRDHFSGLFYTEVTDTENIFPVFDFLYRAWSKKENNQHPLYGIPDGLTVPKKVRAVWPSLVPFLEKMTIDPIDVTSGFQGGVRDIRTWEEDLRCGSYESGYPPDYSEVLEKAPHECISSNTFNCRGKSKADIWRENLPEKVWVPISAEEFYVQGNNL